MIDPNLIPIASVIVIGVFAQWIAWYLNLPSIFILLLCGLAVGPFSGFIRPDDLFGPSFFPLVSLAVGIILFEGGLTLKLSEFRKFGPIIRALCTTGVIATWLLSSLFAYVILGLQPSLSLLLGSILIVTGPTVITPLLRYIRVQRKLSMALRWEGIVTDPIGAVLAVLVFEAITSGGILQLPSVAFIGIAKTILLGIVFGWVFYKIIIFLFQSSLIPEFLETSLILLFIVGSFALSNFFQKESGLLTTTLIGFLLANQNRVPVHRIVEFKENLRVLLLAILFILLPARLELSDIRAVGYEALLFLISLIFIVRPLAVYISTFFLKELSGRERLFLCFVCPRGVVAAAVSSLFSLELAKQGVPQAETISIVMFIVILGTVSFYGIFSKPIAGLLGVSQPEPQGVVIIGANRWSREIAKKITSLGYAAVLIDSNRYNAETAIKEGLVCVYGDILDEEVIDNLDIEDCNKLIALTPNDEINRLSCVRFSRSLGEKKIFKVRQSAQDSRSVNYEAEGRYLFDPSLTFSRFQELSEDGFKITELGAQELESNPRFKPLFFRTKTNKLYFITQDKGEARAEVAQYYGILES